MRLLYIEDDEIDVLAMKRLLRGVENIELTICPTMKELSQLDLSNFDIIISDSNLPDGDYKELRKFLPKDKTQFISGSDIDDFDVWLKPISKLQLETVLKRESTINMSYIEDLADGDKSYEKEMIEVALKVLPERMDELNAAKQNIEALKAAAHKTKSSYRVCGMDNSVLAQLEHITPAQFNDISEKERLLQSVGTQISAALIELEKKIS